MKIHISKDFSLPLDSVTQRFAFLGRVGSGKTYAATKSAEAMLEVGAQVVALDPVGIWYGLRVAGEGKPFSIPVFGGLHGDVPLESTAGALIADLIVDRNISAILDTSQFEIDTEKSRFARDFAARFFFRKKGSPSAVHLFIEESQEYIPQNPARGEEQMLHAFTRMAKLGRNFGIGLSLISQRPQEVNKKVLNLTECLFAFQMTGKHERKAMEEWAVSRGVDEAKLSEILPFLKVGHCHAWSPQWLEIDREVHIAEKRTADVSSTPKVGAKTRAAKELTPVDLEKIREAMSATIEKAKADDPRELRKQIADLNKQVMELEKRPTKQVEIEISVVPKVVLEAIEQLKDTGKHFDEQLTEITNRTNELSHRYDAHKNSIKELEQAAVSIDRMERKAVANGLYISTAGATQPPRREVAKRYGHDKGATNGLSDALGRCEHALLTVLAQRHPEPTTSSQLAILSGYSVKSSGFANAKSFLRTSGFMEGHGESLRATNNGRNRIGHVEPLPTGRALVDYWKNKLGLCPRSLLGALVEAYPRALSRAELSRATGYSVSSSGFANALSELRTLALIERGDPIRVSETFFDN